MRLDYPVVRGAVGFLVVFAVAACTGQARPVGNTAPAPEVDRSGAALAQLIVANETGHALTIAFRPATPPGGEVVVGRVAAGVEAALAPVPAGEPIILVARTPEHRELALRPRTFPVDAAWVWRIAADATFNEAIR